MVCYLIERLRRGTSFFRLGNGAFSDRFEKLQHFKIPPGSFSIQAVARRIKGLVYKLKIIFCIIFYLQLFKNIFSKTRFNRPRTLIHPVDFMLIFLYEIIKRLIKTIIHLLKFHTINNV